MGTLQNGIEWVFRAVAEACAHFPVQTVISLGGGLSPEDFRDLPGDPIVVRYAPQLALLSRAALTIFHGGLNTALESLAHGVPMIAIPITFDQPGVGARLVWTGAGRMIPIRDLTAERLRVEMLEILTNTKYRTNAKLLQKQAPALTGVRQAADIIERVIERRPSYDTLPFHHAIASLEGSTRRNHNNSAALHRSAKWRRSSILQEGAEAN